MTKSSRYVQRMNKKSFKGSCYRHINKATFNIKDSLIKEYSKTLTENHINFTQDIDILELILKLKKNYFT